MQYKWVALTVTTVGALMSSIDSRIVVIGLPVIAQQLHAGAEDAVWITQAYVLSSAIFLVFIGRITDLFGRVRLYNIGFVVFTVGSTFAALSSSLPFLISSRIVQGVGAGILTANSAAIVTDASPKNELGFLLGINGASIRVGSIIGLTLSGLILSVTDWRGLFYVNIPIGVFGTLWAYKRLREISTRDQSKKMDWSGAIFFSTGLTLVLLAITYLGYGFGSYVEGIGSLVAGMILLTLFVRTERRTPSPLLDLKLFRITLYSAGNLAQVLNVIAWSGVLLLLAFYLEIGLGMSPLGAGISLIPLEVTFLVVSLVAGKLSDMYGTRTLTSAGLLINIFALLIAATFGPSTGYLEIFAVLVGLGIGNGMFASPNQRAIMGSVPANRRGVASAFRVTMNNIGWALSFGLVVLFMTVGIPYSNLSQLLGAGQLQQVSPMIKAEFYSGFHAAVLMLAAMDAAAVVPSLLRGPSVIIPSIEEPDET